MRISDYTISIPLRNRMDSVLLVHGYTGAIDVVSRDILMLMESHGRISNKTQEVLCQRGYLTEKNSEEEAEYVNHIANVLARRNLLEKKSFTFVVSYACNFKCSYCFERNRLNNVSKVSFKVEDIDKLFQTLLEIEPNKNLHSKVITLFGGEPLVKSNLPVVERIVSRGYELGYCFTATTNGYDLNHFTHLLGRNKIVGVQVTIDGPEEVHDCRRIHQNNTGSYSKIVENIQKAISCGVMVKVRVNVDTTNIENIRSLIIDLEKKDILHKQNFRLYTEYIGGQGNFCPSDYLFAKDSLSIETYFKTLMSIGSSYPSSDVYENLYNSLTKGSQLHLNPYHCSANTQSYILDPCGNIYACHEFVGMNEYVLGRYLPVLSWDNDAVAFWRERIATRLRTCRQCKYVLLCGGGCTAKAINLGQDHCCDDFEIKLIGTINQIINLKEYESRK